MKSIFLQKINRLLCFEGSVKVSFFTFKTLAFRVWKLSSQRGFGLLPFMMMGVIISTLLMTVLYEVGKNTNLHFTDQKIVLKSLINYSVAGVRNRVCFTENWGYDQTFGDLNNIGSCSTHDFTSANGSRNTLRLLFNPKSLEAYCRRSDCSISTPDLSVLDSGNINLTSLSNDHLLKDTFPWTVEYFRVRIERLDQVAESGYVSLENELYLGVTAYIKRSGRSEISLSSKFLLTPREMNHFSLVLSGNLNIYFNDSSFTGTTLPLGGSLNKGIKFYSPVFVNGNLTLADNNLSSTSNHELLSETYVGGALKEIVAGVSRPFTLGSAQGSVWSDRNLPRRLQKVIPEKQDPALTAWNAGLDMLDFTPQTSCLDKDVIKDVAKVDGLVQCWGSGALGQITPATNYTAVKLVGHVGYSCGLNSNNEVRCWGSNAFHRFPPEGTKLLDIAAGGSFDCGIKMDRSVECWGHFSVSPPTNLRAKQITVSQYSACAIDLSSEVRCWGAPFGGRLQPAELYAVALDSDRRHACVIKFSKDVECWGAGGGTNSPSGLKAKQISVGEFHSCAIDLRDRMVCWGNGAGYFFPTNALVNSVSPIYASSISSGQTGICWISLDGITECFGPLAFLAAGSSSVPTNLTETIRKVAHMSDHVCSIGDTPAEPLPIKEPVVSASRLSCWGGRSGKQALVPPVKVGWIDDNSRVVSLDYQRRGIISLDSDDFCLINQSGKYECWNSEWLPNNPSALGDRIRDLAIGSDLEICALRHDNGHAYCWRAEKHHRRGDGLAASVPRSVWNQSYSQIAMAKETACAVKESDGGLQCWGGGRSPSNTWDQARRNPPNITGVVQIAGEGGGHFCARTNAGVVHCWGDNSYSQATPPSGLVAWDVAVGDNNSCAIIAGTRQVVCWGLNAYGANTPPANLAAIKLDLGSGTSCAVRVDGRAVCWGDSLAEPQGGNSLSQVFDIAVGQFGVRCALTKNRVPFSFNSLRSSDGTSIWGLFNSQLSQSLATTQEPFQDFARYLGKDSRPYIKGLGVQSNNGKTIFSFLTTVSGYDYISDLSISLEGSEGALLSDPRVNETHLSNQNQNPITDSYRIGSESDIQFGHTSGYKRYVNSNGEKVYDAKGVLSSIIIDDDILQANLNAWVTIKLKRAFELIPSEGGPYFQRPDCFNCLVKSDPIDGENMLFLAKPWIGVDARSAVPLYTTQADVVSDREFRIPLSHLRSLAESTSYYPFGVNTVTYNYYTQETNQVITSEDISSLGDLGLVGAKYRFTNHGSGNLQIYSGDDLFQDFSNIVPPLPPDSEPPEVTQCRQDFVATLPDGTQVDLSSQDQFSLSWGQSLSSKYLAAWSFAVDEERLNCDDSDNLGVCGQDKIFLTGSDFQVYADIREEHTCIIRKQVPSNLPPAASVQDYTIFSGFVVCPRVRIEVDGEFSFVGTIITKSLEISSSGQAEDLVNFYSIYHPEGLRILRENVLSTRRALTLADPNSDQYNAFKKCATAIEDVSGSVNYGSSVSAPSWEVANESLFRDCSYAALREKAQPLKWTAFTPDCDPTQIPVSCKEQPINFIIRELR